MSDPKQPQPRKTVKRATWEWIKSLAIAVVIWLFLRTFVIEAFRIPSGSMERTLLVGDFLFVNKALYGAQIPFTSVHLPAIRNPRLHDIVVFDSRTEGGVKVVKRVVGMPGDTLEMRHAVLSRNGVRLVEPYVEHTDPSEDPTDAMMRWQV